MTVTAIVPSKHVKDRYYLELDGGAEKLTITINQIADHSLFTGRELTDEELESLRRDASVSGARATALRILEICSRPELRREMRVAQVDISSDTWITLALADGEQILLSHDGLETKLERFPLMRDAARRRGLDLSIYNMTSDANYAATAAPGAAAGGAHP